MAQLSTSVRSSLNEQLTWLQGKHNAEVDLLEDMRQFARQRSAMEKQYSENLHRLVTQFVGKREPLKTADVPGFERDENRGLMEVWKALLEKTDELSKRRLTISELLLSQVSEIAKQQKRVKEANYKRLIEICQKMNSEILESTKELGVCKKSYSEVEKVCEEARAKHNEAESRVKKRDMKFFESFSSLEKTHKKTSDRLKSCQKRAICNRNDYLLSLAATNAHLKRYAITDLPQLMQLLDGDMYRVVRQAYSSYARLECDAAVFVKAEFEDLGEQANFVNREYVLEMFLQQHPTLRHPREYKFDACGQDTVTAINKDHGAEIFLDKDARKWANKLTKDQASIASNNKQIKGLQTVTSAYAKNPEFGTSESYTEALLNIDQLQEELRQLEVQVTRAQARLEALRQAGVDVNKWLQKAESIQGDRDRASSSTNELTPNLSHGRVSQLSLPSSVGGSQDFDVETSSINSGQLGPDDTTSMTSSKSETLPKKCRVLYNYTAQRADELDIEEQEELEVLEWDDGDGWCRGKNSVGMEGYFPQSYVQALSRSSSPALSIPSTVVSMAPSAVTQMSVSSVSSTITAGSFTSLPYSLSIPNGRGGSGTETWLKAVYDYTAQYEEELSFPEGAIIKLLRTDENGIDDGWWEGSYLGKVGVFPSLVVEIMSSGSVSPDMNSTILPPPDSPPPPSESPPPLPPDCLPTSSCSPHGETSDLGPSPKFMQDYPHDVSRSTPINQPSTAGWQVGGAPAVKLHDASPVDGSRRGMLFSDSFEEYDGDESFV